MKHLFFITLFVLCTGCSDGSAPVEDTAANKVQSNEVAEQDVKYKILSDEKYGTEKRTVKVLLDNKVSEKQLENLAYKIQKMNSEKFKRTFIMYDVKNVEMESAWATTHFDPNLKVTIWDHLENKKTS
ncbi:MAG: hypothetical protein E7K63_02745 [Acinetobacter baumannii]|nr:hypothetical protein [Acinetobacter baumannii]